MQDYWNRFTQQRLTRRRAIATTGASAAAAAFLAACGGGNDSPSGGTGDSTGLITKPVDNVKQAKRGGTIKDRIAADTSTLDPIGPVSPLAANKYDVSPLVRSA